jgi:hypothetical protein
MCLFSGVIAMRRLITLKTETGRRVYVHLDNFGAGVDRLYRRWNRERDGWRCVDTGEVAQLSGLFFNRRPKPSASHWR